MNAQLIQCGDGMLAPSAIVCRHLLAGEWMLSET
jgi:hypothetical protein